MTVTAPAFSPVVAPVGPAADATPTLTERVAAAIAELRPHLNRDGGDIELVEIDGDIVVVDLKGTCVGCVLSSVTIAGVRKRIVEAVGRPLRVVPRAAFVPLKRMRAAR